MANTSSISDIEAALDGHFSYCQETGLIFGRRGTSVGFLNKDGHLSICFRGKTFAAHRLALRLVHGTWPEGLVDHINQVKTDNRLSNLRVANHVVNALNRCIASKGSASGVLGVTKNARAETYTARICVNGKHIVVGTYPTEEEAHEAYSMTKREAIAAHLSK